MRTIKAGIIGTGFIGPAHLEAVRRLGFVEVVAVAERDQATADAKAELLGIPRAYGDYRALLADPEIEVVHDCTPNNMHYEVNTAILNAGKHCISEKPLAMNSQESQALVALAAKKGLVNAVDFNYRFYPLVQHAKAMCADGDLGDVYAIHGSYLQDWLYLDTDYNWRLEPEVSGESRAVADVGSHWCDLVQFITGRTITEVYGDLVTVHKVRKKPKGPIETYAGKLLGPGDYQEVPINTEDYATVLFVLDNGAHGCFTVCQVAAGRKNRLYYEIDGSKCALAWDQEQLNELWVGYREKANEVIIKDPSLLKEAARPYAHYPGGHPEGYPDGPKNLFRNVYQAVAGDAKALPYSTFEDGHREVAICEAILKSHRERAWTKVAYQGLGSRAWGLGAGCREGTNPNKGGVEMKVGIFTVLFSDQPFEAVLDKVAEAGCEAVEIGCGGYPGNAHCDAAKLLKSEAARTQFLKAIKSRGLVLSALSVHGNPLHPQTKIAKQFHDDWRAAVQLAAALKVERVITFSGCPGDSDRAKYPNWVTCAWPPDYPEILKWQWEEKLIPYWKAEAAYAKKLGIKKICFEMHPGFTVHNPEGLMRLREAVGESIGANFDPSHLYWQGMDPVAAIRYLGKAIYHFHAKDVKIDPYNTAKNGVLDTKPYTDEANRSWVFRTIGWGHDAQAWKDMVSALRLVGYDWALSIEHEDSLMSFGEGFRRAVAFLKECTIQEAPPKVYWA